MNTSSIYDDLKRAGIEPTPALKRYTDIVTTLHDVAQQAATDRERELRELIENPKLTKRNGIDALNAAIDAKAREQVARQMLNGLSNAIRRGESRAVAADADALWAACSDRLAFLAEQIGEATRLIGTDIDYATAKQIGGTVKASYDEYLAAANVVVWIRIVLDRVAKVSGDRSVKAWPASRFVDPDQLQTRADIVRADAVDTDTLSHGVAELIAAGFTVKVPTAAEYNAAVARCYPDGRQGMPAADDRDAWIEYGVSQGFGAHEFALMTAADIAAMFTTVEDAA